MARKNRIVTHDAAVQNGLGFIQAQLTKYDPTINEPLFNSTWARDLPVKVGGGQEWAEYTSYVKEYYTSPNGGMGTDGGQTNDIQAINGGVDYFLAPTAVYANQLVLPYLDLERDGELIYGPRIKELLTRAIIKTYDVFLQTRAYYGDEAKQDFYGLLNHADISVTAPTNGGWLTNTNHELILDDINNVIDLVWNQTGTAVLPNQILLPTQAYSKLATTPLTSLGYQSILAFLEANNIVTLQGGDLKIFPLIQANDAGVGDTDRMVVYSNNIEHVYFDILKPLTANQTAWSASKEAYMTTYRANIGATKFIYPETAVYVDSVL